MQIGKLVESMLNCLSSTYLIIKTVNLELYSDQQLPCGGDVQIEKAGKKRRIFSKHAVNRRERLKFFKCVNGARNILPNSSLRGAIKKKLFFFTFSKKLRPPSPFFDHLSFFLIRIFWIGPAPPPLFGPKTTCFLYKTPIFWQTMPKNLIKPFWIG